MCVFSYLERTEYQNTHSASKLRRFLDDEDILASPHNLKGLLDLVGWGQNCVKVRVRVGVRVKGLVGMVKVRVRDWVIHSSTITAITKIEVVLGYYCMCLCMFWNR